MSTILILTIFARSLQQLTKNNPVLKYYAKLTTNW